MKHAHHDHHDVREASRRSLVAALVVDHLLERERTRRERRWIFSDFTG